MPFRPPEAPPDDAAVTDAALSRWPSDGVSALLPTVSLVERAMGDARRALGLVLGLAALMLLVLVGERWVFGAAQQAATERHAEALRVAASLRLLDLQRTTSAQMAVITAQPEWMHRFDALRLEMGGLLQHARMLAPAAAVARFDSDTAVAVQALDDMRESAFEALMVYEPDVARRIFEGERYRDATAVLQSAIAEFSEATVAEAQAEIERLQRYSTTLGVSVLAAVLALGALTWRRFAGSRAELIEAEGRVRHLAASDLLTGLPNRAALHDAMVLAMARSARAGRPLAVLMIDLDRFKPVNDRHGHLVGDRVLAQAAARLKRCLRASDFCARYGGDEFVVLVDDDDGALPQAHRIAERAAQALSAPMSIDGHVLAIGASAGIARYPDDGLDADDLLRKADSALYRAKASRRGGACSYELDLDERIAERARLEQAIREGLERGEFVAHFQPIVDLASRRVHSVELLARWQHPERGLLAPAAFIPLAEESGLIAPLTLAVLRSACGELHHLPAHWRLSLNIAPQQIQDEQLVPHLQAVLAERGVPAARLDVELTETALVRDTDAARRVMQAMQAAGFTVTLDDFGTGHSSLAYLAALDFDKLKVDRSFVHTLRERPQSAKVVDAIIGLSRSLGVPTVAEGIETEDDAARLLRMGCTLGQGYLFGRPMPAHELAAHDLAALAARDAHRSTPEAVDA